MIDDARRERFLRLMDQYQAALARLAGAYLDDPADRDDLVQEIAAAIWQALPRFRGDASERTWLYRIAHNTAITVSGRIRRRSRTRTELDDGISSPATRIDDQLAHEQQRRLLLDRIRVLPEADRQAIVMHLEGLGNGEIAEVTGATPGAVATRLSRIRERLTHELR